jgi:vitamin K-dependent gamma-carboxylase
MKKWIQNRIDLLSQPVSASTLGVFRLLFGGLMVTEFYDFYIYFSHYLVYTQFLVQHDGFEWLQIMPEELMLPIFTGLMISAGLFALGIYYRINSIVIFTGFAYIFFLDKGHYNNHFYLYTMILFFFQFVDATWGSFAIKKVKMIPYWQLFIFKFQIFIVYFYGGIAKIDSDWLQGYPMRYWLVEMTQNSSSWLKGFYASEFGAYFFSWGGLLFDLLIGFGLFSRKFRRISIVIAVVFHLHNKALFSIGSFPFAMICTMILFANPRKGEWLKAAFIAHYKVPFQLIRKLMLKTKTIFQKSPGLIIDYSDSMKSTALNPFRTKLSVRFFMFWFCFQLTIPFRHFAYEGDPAWTGEGHLFAWRMMLVDTTDGVRYFLEVPETKELIPIDILQYVTYRQFYKMSRTPKSFVKLAHHLAGEVRKAGGIEKPIIRMEIIKSVNGRSPKVLNDITLNYALIEYEVFKHADWILTWDRTDEELVYDLNRFQNWKSKIEIELDKSL